MTEKVMWGTAGIGKLGTALLTQWAGKNQKTGLYHPDAEKAERAADALSADVLSRKALGELDYLVLALPADQMIPFIKSLQKDNIPLEKTTLINMATKLETAGLRTAFPELNWASVKFVGHAESLKRDGSGLFVSEDADEHVRERFSSIGRVESAPENTAEQVNKMATSHAVRAAKQLELEMKEEGWEEVYINEALRSLLPEVVRAYADGNLGQFGRKIAEDIEKGKSS
jgi:pyrroline-5-carboxylate reductase